MHVISISAFCFSMLFFCCSNFLVLNIAMYISQFIIPIGQGELMRYVLISPFVLFCSYRLFLYFKSYKAYLYTEDTRNLLGLADLVIVLATAATFTKINLDLFFNLHILAIRILIISSALLFMHAVLILLKEIETNKLLNINLNNLNQLHNAEKHYFDSVIENKKETDSFKQQIKKQARHLLSLLEQEKYEELDRYTSQMIGEDKLRHVNLCGHQTLDAVVGYWQLKAWKKGIAFQADFMVDKISTNDTDLAIILGNALENAYTATLSPNLQDPLIKIKVCCQGGMLLINIQNNYADPIIMNDDQYYSHKRSYKEYGTGLSNIKLLAEKYDGFFEVQYDNNLFNLKIALPN